MDNVHSLTAYKLSFSYMLRSNPLKDELAEAIQTKEKPSITIQEFLQLLIDAGNFDGCITIKGSAFKLEGISNFEKHEDYKRYLIVPKAGKAGKPFRVYKIGRREPYQFGSDAASLYDNIMYLYEFADGNSYLICHRFGRSGCKTIFQKVSSEVLKEKGIKLDFDLILPPGLKDGSDYEAQRITMTYSVPSKSSDIADHMDKQVKTKVIKTLILDLQSDKFSPVNKTIDDYKLKRLTKEEAFATLKAEINDTEYNGAKVLIKIGNSKRTIDWDTFENAFEGKDITEEIHKLSPPLSFNDALSKCSDEYIAEIRSRE